MSNSIRVFNVNPHRRGCPKRMGNSSVPILWGGMVAFSLPEDILEIRWSFLRTESHHRYFIGIPLYWKLLRLSYRYFGPVRWSNSPSSTSSVYINTFNSNENTTSWSWCIKAQHTGSGNGNDDPKELSHVIFSFRRGLPSIGADASLKTNYRISDVQPNAEDAKELELLGGQFLDANQYW